MAGPSHAAARLVGALALVLTLIAGGAWLTAGPLPPGWVRRAGAPATDAAKRQLPGAARCRRGTSGGAE